MTAAPISTPPLREDPLALARDVALYCAASLRRAGAQDAWEADAPRALRARADALETSEAPVVARWRERFGTADRSLWLALFCAAAERYQDVAYALGAILGSSSIALPTPYTIAWILSELRGVPIGPLLAELIDGGEAARLGVIERAEAPPGCPASWVPFRLSAREAPFLLGTSTPAAPISPLVLRREPPAPAPALPGALVARAAEHLRAARVICVRARTPRAARQLALDLASACEQEVLFVACGDEPPSAREVVRLRSAVVAVDLFGACAARGLPEAWMDVVAMDAERVVVMVPQSTDTGQWVTVDAGEMDHEAHRRVWRSVLAGLAADTLATRFKVGAEEARAAVRAASLVAGGPPSVDEISHALLTQGARRMGRSVTVLCAQASLDDLVVPEGIRTTLQDVLDSRDASATVFGEWKVAARTTLGRGVACLFSGPPGTGKTFASQCIAASLGLNLYQIDLSQVVSKYIGETEKSLARVFDEAEAGHGVLLFDEADALFGKRAEVKDAHDRYANVEVAYLLQRMESFEGISILTTNLRNNLDAAFLRRLRFVVEFPMPDEPTRAVLWERSLPPRRCWHPEVDVQPLVERFPLAGGNIHTIGLAAAHLAAAQPERVLRPEHLVRATWRELEKLGMGRSRDDFGPLGRYLPRGAW